MRSIYLLLSCLGLLMPVLCFGMHFTGRGEAAWPEFFAAPFATWVISGFSWDLILTATACTLWMLVEAKRLNMRGTAWHILLIFGVGICFALPTFLYRREAHLDPARRIKSRDQGQQTDPASHETSSGTDDVLNTRSPEYR